MQFKHLKVVLFVWLCCHACVFSSFPGMEESLQRFFSQAILPQIVERVRQEHQELAKRQSQLYQALIREESDLDISTESASQSSKTASSSKLKAVTENWDTTNFALLTLLIVTRDGDIIPMRVYPSSTNENPTTIFAPIYDSRVDCTHNKIPSLLDSYSQWQRYLSETSLIFGEGTIKARQKIEESLNNIQQRVVSVTQEEDPEQIINCISAVCSDIDNYHSVLKTWISTGWHSEQRIIFDLDQIHTSLPLKGINKSRGITSIIACLHTRLSPCVSDQNSITCDCLQCLKNWPKRWQFKQDNSDIPVFMSVSYTDLFKTTDEYQAALRQAGENFFIDIIQTQTTAAYNVQEQAIRWVTDGMLQRQLNWLRCAQKEVLPVSDCEMQLYDAIKPLLSEQLQLGYEASDNLAECRFLKVCNDTLQFKRTHLKGLQAYYWVFYSESSLEHHVSEILLKIPGSDLGVIPLYAKPKLKANAQKADNDWSLLIKMLCVMRAKAVLEKEEDDASDL